MNNADNTQDKSQLIAELKEILVDTLNLDDIEPEEIGDTEALFGSGLDLDSIDALEFVVSLEKRYGIKIGSSEESKQALESLDTLADLILSKQS